MTYEFAYGKEKIRYRVQRVLTRRTLGIEVHPDRSVVVRAPVGCADEVISARVKKRAAWISRQIADFQRYSPRTPQRQYVSGETHLYLGRQYRLKVIAGEQASVRIGRSQLMVTVPGTVDPGRVRMLLYRWYLDHARRVFSEVLEQCLPRLDGCQPPRLIIRTMQSRWGSLSQAGCMTLNASLIRAPRSCIEYVVTHELCHLRHRDHDTNFFRLLGRVMPDWEKRKRRLEAALI
ncbi:MAG: M48 family metallopeptidase [Nitrosospira multiformis]|nr:M48 family metallopeptidase [Nitrosospira multiformis]